MYMQDHEIEYVLREFKASTYKAHSKIWKNRSYAPMFIHSEHLKTFHSLIQKHYPEYTITFDVIFETDGKEIPWHCDFESLGPFEIKDLWTAIKKEHFLTIHTNLTPKGGHLKTMNIDWLSYLHGIVNRKYNIFSIPYFITAYLTKIFEIFFALSYQSNVGHANVFNNLQTHCVTQGDPRISYVVRLVKNEIISRNVIENSTKTSQMCNEFVKFIKYCPKPTYVHDFPWSKVIDDI